MADFFDIERKNAWLNGNRVINDRIRKSIEFLCAMMRLGKEGEGEAKGGSPFRA